ncbi:hypothetical protein HK104_001604, partial [Borealophlyctis nickersoniae]
MCVSPESMGMVTDFADVQAPGAYVYDGSRPMDSVWTGLEMPSDAYLFDSVSTSPSVPSMTAYSPESTDQHLCEAKVEEDDNEQYENENEYDIPDVTAGDDYGTGEDDEEEEDDNDCGD